ncbi:uncharacterized protein J3R85_002364 [Psidium guajava]|nr:uncharacterized protein J3R85_002364 [Psidium guajava]
MAIMDVDVVYDDVTDVLQRDASAAHDVDVRPPAVHRLVAVEDELLGQPYQHVRREDDPQRLLLDHRVPERARLRAHGVVVRRVGDDVYLAVLPAERVLAEPDRAVGEPLPVVGPVRVALPAVVDRVAGHARGVLALGRFQHLPSSHGSIHSPVRFHARRRQCSYRCLVKVILPQRSWWLV